MKKNIPIELLAPAKNTEFGKTAINYGADAVYIGAPHFGARASVSNTIGEIEQLIRYAHLFNAKVYAALNTILFDNELPIAEKLIRELYEAGADGIIIQDMGILELNLPPIPIHASTQTHNNTPEKVLFLEKVGFKRVILARELSLQEITEIRGKTTVELESFVHGALCVSYSGQCYMSQAVCGRSGNRGICAQPCRSAYDLVDRNGDKIVSHKHLLSLKDLNLSRYIPALMDAGITSFKIEGRLKDVQYIKNVVTYYRREIDNVLTEKKEYSKSSLGKTIYHFVPDPEKSFNRGFTTYFVEGRKEKPGSFLTQKSLGKKIGKITELGANWFKADGEGLSNADGICYFDTNGNLTGTFINNVSGSKYFPKDMNELRVGLEIYRNHDQQFEKLLANDAPERKIEIKLSLTDWDKGIQLEGTDEDNITARVQLEIEKIPAEKIDFAKHQITGQLSKLGNTPFNAAGIDIKTNTTYFIPASALNQLRRNLVTLLEEKRLHAYKTERVEFIKTNIPYPEKHLTYFGNALNLLAVKFYNRHGVEKIEPAYETLQTHENNVVMTTKHCIRYQLDVCPTHQKSSKKLNEPLYLKDNKHTYRLEFDCKQCLMRVIFEN